MKVVKSILLGTLELSLFLTKGASRMPQDRQTAINSFAVPFVLLPIWIYAFYLEPTPLMGEQSYSWLFWVHLLSSVLEIVGFYAVLWLIVAKFERKDKFWTFVTAKNFSSLVGFVISAPLVLLVLNGSNTWEEVFPMFVVLAFYEVALTAFISTFTLSIPWQMGGGIGFFSFLLTEQITGTVIDLFK